MGGYGGKKPNEPGEVNQSAGIRSQAAKTLRGPDHMPPEPSAVTLPGQRKNPAGPLGPDGVKRFLDSRRGCLHPVSTTAASDQTQQAERGEGEGGGFGDGGGDFQVVKRCEFIMGLHAYYSKGRTLEPDGITPPPSTAPPRSPPKKQIPSSFLEIFRSSGAPKTKKRRLRRQRTETTDSAPHPTSRTTDREGSP